MNQVHEETTTTIPDEHLSIVLGTCEAVGFRVFKMSGQEHHCSILSSPSGDHQRIKLKEEAVFSLSKIEKQQLLATQDLASFAQRDSHASQLIEALGRLDPSVSEMFALKSEAVGDAPLRLLKPRTILANADNISRESDESFIALSYCWHSEDWYKTPEEIPRGPISDDLFFALLQERLYPAEGIWIDQLCINQDDQKEKAVAVASMDIIYKSARLVVVMLEDIWIDKSEEGVLRGLIDMYRKKSLLDLNTKPELSRIATGLLWKIFSARWFSRAWCGHELRVSNNQVFLIRIKGEDGVCGKIVRITAEFLHDLTIIEADFVSWVAGSDEFKSMKALYKGRSARYNKLIYDRLSRSPEALIQPQGNAKMPSYMRTFAETFSLQSSITSDKLAIALNISQCGLYLKCSVKTSSECCELFTLLALAAGDSTALSSSGDKLRRDGNKLSWIQWPRPGDIVEPFLTGALHRRLDSVPACDVEKLKMETLILGNSKEVLDVSETSRGKANWFMQGFAMVAEGRYLPEEFSEQKDLLIEVLACALECGQDWIVAGVKSKGSLPVDYLLGPALEAFFGDHVDHNEANCEDNWEVFREQEDHFDVILGLLDGLLGAWLPQRPQDWIPATFQVGSDPVNKLLIMCPKKEEYLVVLPALLAHEDYDFLNRIWIVTASSDDYDNQGWKVIGKSTSFGAIDLVKACQFGDLRPGQLFVG